MLKINQIHKVTHYDSIYMKCPGKSIETVDQWLPGEGGIKEQLLMGTGFPFGGENVLELDNGDDCAAKKTENH